MQELSQKQNNIIFADSAQTRSLYIHWPFCPYKCSFCPFVAFSGRDSLMDSYHDSLKNELIFKANEYAEKRVLDTVYFGGGTPSTYPEKKILDMFDTIRDVCILKNDAEITLEVNPGTVNKSKIETWKQVGINRLSIGVQSLDDKILANLNRDQKCKDVYELLDQAVDNFSSVSVDLIVGLPGVDFASWQKTLQTLIKWNINHISMYFLTVHQGTPLYSGLKSGKFTLPGDEVVDHYNWACEYLKQNGFMQYEVSSFAKKNHIAKHNSMYWQRKPFLGVGVGAFSFDGHKRMQNCKSLLKYLDSFASIEEISVIDSLEFTETLNDKQILLEKIMLGVRCFKGAEINEVTEFLTDFSKDKFYEFIDECISNELLKKDQNKIFFTSNGAAVENEILERFARIVVLK